MAVFFDVFAGGIATAFVKVGAEAAGAVMGDEDAMGSADVLEVVVAGHLEGPGEGDVDFDFTDEGEVVAIALVGEVNAGAIEEAAEEGVFPNVFVEDGVGDDVVEVRPGHVAIVV